MEVRKKLKISLLITSTDLLQYSVFVFTPNPYELKLEEPRNTLTHTHAHMQNDAKLAELFIGRETLVIIPTFKSI